jgi:hypothetical protein
MKVNYENSRIWIRIHQSESWIRGSGSVVKCHGSVKLMEDPSHLKAGALVGQLPHAVQYQVHDLLADGVVAARIIVCRVLLALQSKSTVVIFQQI